MARMCLSSLQEAGEEFERKGGVCLHLSPTNNRDRPGNQPLGLFS